jgi:hypothetical protein
VAISILGMVSGAALLGQEETEKPNKDPKSSARLEFMRKAVQEIVIKPTDPADERDLKFKPQPLLRYNDPARRVADSAVWRVGSNGRPTAIVTSEVYGPLENKRFQLNHEFLAIDNPRLTMHCGGFVWVPPATTTLKFQKFKTDEKPADRPQLRLLQIKRLAQKFTMREFHEGNKIELRLLPTPIDRYEPSDKLLADGAIFAGVWGVNPEILLFIETDGESWSYAFARMGSAKLWAVLDDVEVWNVPGVYVTATMPYSITVNPVSIPATVFDNSSDDKKP